MVKTKRPTKEVSVRKYLSSENKGTTLRYIRMVGDPQHPKVEDAMAVEQADCIWVIPWFLRCKMGKLTGLLAGPTYVQFKRTLFSIFVSVLSALLEIRAIPRRSKGHGVTRAADRLGRPPAS